MNWVYPHRAFTGAAIINLPSCVYILNQVIGLVDCFNLFILSLLLVEERRTHRVSRTISEFEAIFRQMISLTRQKAQSQINGRTNKKVGGLEGGWRDFFFLLLAC